jgi:hypothetical protein
VLNLAAKPERKKLRGRLRRTWNIIKIFIEEVGSADGD